MAQEQIGNPEKEMSFLGHLEELRWRLVRAAIAVVVVAVVLFIFTEPIVKHVFLAMKEPDFPTYRFFCWLGNQIGAGDALCVSEIPIDIISLKMAGQFNTNMYFALVGGIIAAFPFIFYQFWAFIKPALKERELKVSKGIVFNSSLLFLLGIAFGYFVISPLCVQFFGTYKMVEGFEIKPSVNSYMSLITTTTLIAGLFFELPVVIYLLTKLGIVSPELLKKYRKHAIVVVLVLSAIITPPDVVSQVIVALPVMGLYEIGIYVSSLVTKRKKTA